MVRRASPTSNALGAGGARAGTRRTQTSSASRALTRLARGRPERAEPKPRQPIAALGCAASTPVDPVASRPPAASARDARQGVARPEQPRDAGHLASIASVDRAYACRRTIRVIARSHAGPSRTSNALAAPGGVFAPRLAGARRLGRRDLGRRGRDPHRSLPAGNFASRAFLRAVTRWRTSHTSNALAAPGGAPGRDAAHPSPCAARSVR
jgi:hypothetical protein